MMPLLPLTSRIVSDASHNQQLRQAAQHISDWTAIPAAAEAHGLGPLLYTHLRRAGIPLPTEPQRQLKGLYLRHRRANQVRAEVLAEIIAAYQTVGIQVLVLKGSALAHLIYPEPGLRPMGDIDLIVSKAKLDAAQQILADFGFHGPPLDSPYQSVDKHLPPITKVVSGVAIAIELHHHLTNKPALIKPIDTLINNALAFSLPSTAAYTLGYEDMLWHLCHHLSYHTSVWKPIRFIWVADIIGFVEQFAHEIDWEKLHQTSSSTLNILALLHYITPLSGAFLQQTNLKVGSRPQGVGLSFQGWPQSSLAAQRQKGIWGILADTFWPPEWWLRLRYSLGPSENLFWPRLVQHPLHIVAWMRHLVEGR